MRKRTPEDRERWRRLKEEGAAARANMQMTLDRIDARLRAEENRREQRRRRLRRLLPFVR